MKILSVRLKNINSLKGEHFIGFNKSPFTESGLFAITGPTGAGKSSILDAITLALYGLAPRFNRDNPLEIMSYHTSDCLAEVEFEIKDKVYRSKWSVHRSRGKVDGEMQQPRMELVDVMADIILESKKTEVINRVTEITGLDYFRFLRSVMLAQGDFAAFLKADEKARGELLEKITGTDIYTKLSKKAFEKQKEKRQKLEQLESLLDTSRLLSTEQKESYQLQVEEYQQNNTSLSKEIEKLSMQLHWLERMELLRAKAIQLKTEFQSACQQKQIHQPDFDRYENHLKTIPFQPLNREVEIAELQIQELNRDIHQIKQDIPILESQKSQVYQSVEQARQALQEAKQLQTARLPVMEKTAEMDRDLQILQDQFKKIRQEIKINTNESNTYQEQLNQQQGILEKHKEKLRIIKDYIQNRKQDACLETELGLIEQNLRALYELGKELQLKQHEAAHNKRNIQELEEKKDILGKEANRFHTDLKWIDIQLKDIDQSIASLLDKEDIDQVENTLQQLNKEYIYRINQLSFSKNFMERRDKVDLLQKEIAENEITFASKGIELQALKEKEKQANDLWIVLQKLCEKENLILNYESARHKLVAGEACPLCGSLHHPFVTEANTIELTQTELQRDAQQQVVGQLRTQIETINKQLNVLEANRTTALKDLKNYSLEITKSEKEFSVLNQQLGEYNEIARIDVLNQKSTDNISEQQRLKTLIQAYKDKTKIRIQYKNQQEALQQSQTEVDKNLTTCKLNLTNSSNNLRSLEKDIYLLQYKQQEQQQSLQQLLKSYQVDFPAEQHFSRCLAELKKRSSTYQEYTKQEKELEKHISELTVEMVKAESSLQKITEQIDRQQLEIDALEKKGIGLREERQKIFGNKIIADEKQRLTTAIEYCEQHLQSLEQALNDKSERFSVRKQQLTDKQHILDISCKSLSVQKEKLVAGLHTAGFPDIAEFQSSMLDAQLANEIKKRKETVEEKINGIKETIHRNEQELKEQGARELTEAGIAEVTGDLKALQNEKEKLIAEAARMEQILRDNEQLTEQHQHLTEDIEKQRKEFQRWKILSDMIGSATGAEFNIFAQGLTLARLVQLANHYLDKLNPRYQIRRKPHADLELEIIDRYQADNIRTMKTLSGGETFLVSLSLALGLSDLAGNKTRIDSLFIDEGFGTLDPQTLDVAITTLENLQATGKMIGIISHVEALKERITTQILVTKQSGGVSDIQVYG